MSELPEKEIIQKYLAGAKIKELGLAYATNISAIYTIMHKNGIKLRRDFSGGRKKTKAETHIQYTDYLPSDDFIEFCKKRIKNKLHKKYFGLSRAERELSTRHTCV